MTYRRYSNDPKWITARFASQCSGCKAPIALEKRKGLRLVHPGDEWHFRAIERVMGGEDG